MCVVFNVSNGCKAMSVLLFDVFSGCSSSIEKLNRLIWKGMSNFTTEKK